jgi:AcrR family transcriptional regulator
MRKDGNLTRGRIVEKSLQLFSVKGYFNTSINDILEATGLTKGGFYGHFASKEELWDVSYERAVEIWRGIVFKGVREIQDPVARIEKVIGNDLFGYLGAEVFEGGCFFFNMLVELSGQSEAMSRRIREGFDEFARLLASWLVEGKRKGSVGKDVDCAEVADFILVAINGAAVLYASRKDRRYLKETFGQLRAYLGHLRV